MKKIITVLLLTSLFAFGQKTQGIAIYKIVLTEKKVLKKANPKLESDVRKWEAEGEKIRPQLKFNNTSAIFYMEGILSLEAETASILYCNCVMPIYTDLKTNKTYKENQAGVIADAGEFIIEREILKNWTVTNETKLIDNYKCTKATQTVYNEEGKPQLVTAWFCPQLSYPFGPSGFGGLPGLIIELQRENIVFGLESLKFLDKKPTIKIPTKGKKVSFENYYKISKERLAAFREQISKKTN